MLNRYLRFALFEGPVDAKAPGPCTLFRRDIGLLHLPTGKLVACDALAIPDMPPFEAEFPVGSFPVSLSVADFGEDQRVAYATIRFSDDTVHAWEQLLVPGQDPATLTDDEYFGYPVDAGVGSFSDASSLELFIARCAADDAAVESVVIEMEKTYVHTWDYANIPMADSPLRNLVIFHSGWGDGAYPTYLGRNAAGRPVVVVTDFQVFSLETDT